MARLRNPAGTGSGIHSGIHYDIVGLLRLFSIHGRWIFPLLVVGLAAISVGAWWSVKSVIDADIRSRLESEGDRVEAILRDRIGIFANGLVDIRGHFLMSGVPTPAQFHDFVDHLEVPRRFGGLNTFGYLAVDSDAVGIHAYPRLIEPASWNNHKNFDFDAMTDPDRRETLALAARTGDPAMTKPVTLIADRTTAAPPVGFMLYLPLYRGEERPTAERPFQGVIGFLANSFRVSEFFESTFGAPSLRKEKVNFSLAQADPTAHPLLLYNRLISAKTLP